LSLEADLVDPVKACAKETGGAAADGVETALAAVETGGAKETGGAGRNSLACQSNMAAAGYRATAIHNYGDRGKRKEGTMMKHQTLAEPRERNRKLQVTLLRSNI